MTPGRTASRSLAAIATGCREPLASVIVMRAGSG